MTVMSQRSLPGWAPGVLLATLVVLSLMQTAQGMVAIWLRHQTYQHAFLVMPIVVWLIWRKRQELAQLPAQPSPVTLVLVALTALLWLMGEVAVVGTASQFALVGLLVLCVPALYGWGIARALAFPLLFTFFSVPFGEFLVPTMMNWTADFTVGALRLVGVPVYKEGLFFVIPSGSWSVIEACSGVRYLIASFMVGTLFAYLNYRSFQRRALFMVMSVVVPLLANWLRAFMIVMLGHFSNNTIAVGVDHLLYGWVFFGIVIGLMFFIGAKWSDASEPGISGHSATIGGLATEPTASLPRLVWMLATFLVLIAAVQWWKAHLDGTDAGVPELPPAATPSGWRVSNAALPWRPAYAGANSERAIAFEDAAGGSLPVWEWTAYYRHQGEDRKLVSIANRVSDPEDRTWRVVEESRLRPSAGGVSAVHQTLLQRGSVLDTASTGLRIWRLYWIDGAWEIDDRMAKLRQAFSALRARGDDGAVVLFATQNSADAPARLEKYLKARSVDLHSELDAVRNAGH